MSHTASDADILQGEYFNIKPIDYYLPLGIITKQDIVKDNGRVDYSKRGELQRILYEDFFGTADGVDVYTLESAEYVTTQNLKITQKNGQYVLKPDEGTAKIMFSLPIEESTTLYFNAFDKNDNDLKQPINEKFSVSVNNSVKDSKYPEQRENGILLLGNYQKGKANVTVTVKSEVSIRDLSVIGIKNKPFAQALEQTQTIGLKEGKNALTGRYTAKGGECVFLSIPYDDGLKLTINGDRKETYEVYDGFIGFYLEAGINEIEISFTPKGLHLGIFFCILGIGLGVAAVVFRKKKDKKFALSEMVENIAYYALLVVGVAVLCLVYGLPVILCAT